MNDRELFERMHAERAPLPDGFDARQEAALRRAMAAPGRRFPVRRTMAAVLAALMLACGAAGAAGYLGVAHFWAEPKPEAEGWIEREIAQTGGVLESATFTVREAVFDGRMLQTVVAVRAADGRIPTAEDGDCIAQNALIVSCVGRQIGGQTWTGSLITTEYEEDGTMLLYACDELAVELTEARVPVALTYRASLPGQAGETTTLTFDVPRVAAERRTCGAQARLEDALTIRSVSVSYTPLGMDVTIDYLPGERLGEATPEFYAIDGEREVGYAGALARTGSRDGGFAVRMRMDTARSLPQSLTIGVRGLRSAVTLDFDRGTATVVETKGETAE